MAKKRSAAKRTKKTKKTKKNGGAQRARALARRAASGAAAAAGTGLDLIAAGEIVQASIPGGPHDIDFTLENAGLITAGQRTIFRTDVVGGVNARGFSIDSGDVPNGSTTTLRQARRAVQQNAH